MLMKLGGFKNNECLIRHKLKYLNTVDNNVMKLIFHFFKKISIVNSKCSHIFMTREKKGIRARACPLD